MEKILEQTREELQDNIEYARTFDFTDTAKFGNTPNYNVVNLGVVMSIIKKLEEKIKEYEMVR